MVILDVQPGPLWLALSSWWSRTWPWGKRIKRAVPIDIGLSSFQIDGVKNENCNCWSRYCRFNGCLLLIKRKKAWKLQYLIMVLDKQPKAAAGIISPWFSKRRIKAWYRMARLGADFYQDLVSNLEKDGYDTSFYDQSGVALPRKTIVNWTLCTSMQRRD